MNKTSPLLSTEQTAVFVDVWTKYSAWRQNIKDANWSMTSFGEAENGAIKTYRAKINREIEAGNLAIERDIATNLVVNIVRVSADYSSQSADNFNSNQMANNIPRVLFKAIALSKSRNNADFSEAFLITSEKLREDLKDAAQKAAELLAQTSSASSTPAPAPGIGGANNSASRQTPASSSKVPNLARMQFDRVGGSNQAGPEGEVFSGVIHLEEALEYVADLEVVFSIRTFTLDIACEYARPSLAPGLTLLTFGDGLATQVATVADDKAGRELRKRLVRFTLQGTGSLLGSSESQTLFTVDAPVVAGDAVALQVRPFQLKVRMADPEKNLPSSDPEGRRVVENWIRNCRLGNFLSDTIELCHQPLI